MPRRDDLPAACRAVTSLVTVVLGRWAVAAAALDRDGAIEAADRRKRSVAVLALGYELYESPAATFNGKEVIVAQAIIWPSKRKA